MLETGFGESFLFLLCGSGEICRWELEVHRKLGVGKLILYVGCWKLEVVFLDAGCIWLGEF